MSHVLFIRADGSPTMGTGHVMRCLALAQSWVRVGGRVVWAQAETTVALTERLMAEGFAGCSVDGPAGSPADAGTTIAHARKAQAAWIVADGYRFGAAWQKQIKDAGFSLLVIDDYGHAESYHADLILNQNASASAELYQNRGPGTRLLLGTRFVLLRREFLQGRISLREIPAVARKILVTLGGSDPDNVTAKVVGSLAQLTERGIEAVVVVGGSNPHLPAIREAIAARRLSIRLMVNATNMPELMAWADVAISAAGSTAWELAFMNLPSLLIVTADNQTGIAEKLARDRVSLNLGPHAAVSAEKIAAALRTLLDDPARRREMSHGGRRLVDHRGVSRVIAYLAATRLKLRNATVQDARLLWRWANEPEVRASAFNPAPIAWETHVAWLNRKLHAANTALFIASDATDHPVGQVRFDWDQSGVAEVDVVVDRSQRKAGIGSALLRGAVDKLFATSRVNSIRALIKPDNHASLGAFENAGFKREGATLCNGHPAVQLTASDFA